LGGWGGEDEELRIRGRHSSYNTTKSLWGQRGEMSEKEKEYKKRKLTQRSEKSLQKVKYQ